MAVGVGQTLDKYELIEKVGQGGMAVVYRGLDTSLGREVAVKVLHDHLAEHQEARDRFEREARAVAKLHHENILEIYDFAGKGSVESYIVTEFIDGQTLKQFITDHHIRFPEIGAMIALQVCRALAHAHSLGILHRDVKPENIMIRGDGAVKLTDFGIAQMIDLQRMTVTGQLLGSPAYMSPEHVEGGQLDFRTDVFAVGIVLYQMVVGDLPFLGKNPHEILKRIADCKYTDPRKANPMVGNELGRIIDTALARDKDERYADVSDMQMALERYLEGSGLGAVKDELARFFEAPVAYEMALEARLVDHLARRGQELAEHDRVAALECFNRVLTIAPEHDEVLAVLDRMSRKSRSIKIAAVFVAVLSIVAAVWAIASVWPRGGKETAVASPGLDGERVEDSVAAAPSVDPPDPAYALTATVDAGAEEMPMRDRAALVNGSVRNDRRVDRRTDRRVRVDAGVAEDPAAPRTVTVSVDRLGSEVRVGNGAWVRIEGRSAPLEVPAGHQVVEVRNDCCQSRKQKLAADSDERALAFTLQFLPGNVVPTCEKPDVRVTINGRPGRLGQSRVVPIENTNGKETVEVTFYSGELGTSRHQVQVGYKETKDVTCAFE